jgi:hypothetical protein
VNDKQFDRWLAELVKDWGALRSVHKAQINSRCIALAPKIGRLSPSQYREFCRAMQRHGHLSQDACDKIRLLGTGSMPRYIYDISFFRAALWSKLPKKTVEVLRDDSKKVTLTRAGTKVQVPTAAVTPREWGRMIDRKHPEAGLHLEEEVYARRPKTPEYYRMVRMQPFTEFGVENAIVTMVSPDGKKTVHGMAAISDLERMAAEVKSQIIRDRKTGASG